MLSRRALVVMQLHLVAQRAANGVAAERQRKARLLVPPDAEIEDLREAIAAVGELAFVDDEAGVELARDHGGNDLVEGHGDGLDLRREELQREIGGGERAGDGDAELLDFVERVVLRGATIMGP